MSNYGEHFNSGGTFMEMDGKKVFVERFCKEGILFLIMLKYHGVDKIDENHYMNWLEYKGRWMGLFANNKFFARTVSFRFDCTLRVRISCEVSFMEKLRTNYRAKRWHAWWLETFAGSACAVIRNDGPLFDLYITGRDEFNRSRIGHGIWSAETPDKILQLDDDPCLGLGKHGSFFDSGTSYPSVIKYKNKYLMYFTGWHQGKKTPFINSMGLAESKRQMAYFIQYPSHHSFLQLPVKCLV